MKFILLLLLFSGCGRHEGRVRTVEVEKIVEVEKPIEVEKIVEIEKAQDFEGVYLLNNYSIIELIADSNDDITIASSPQIITSINPENKTYCEHPKIVGSRIQIIKGALVWSRNVKYTAGQDVEEDVSGSNIIGNRRTDYKIYLLDGVLRLEIRIYQNAMNDNINFVVAKRTFKEV